MEKAPTYQWRSSPAFQFYAKDELAQTMSLTNEELGVYLKLRCVYWVEGGLEDDPRKLARIAGVSPRKFSALWKNIARFFYSESGRLWHQHLEAEREKQQQWREKSAEGGRRSAERRRKGGTKGGTNGGTKGGSATVYTNGQHCSLHTAVETDSTLSNESGGAPPPKSIHAELMPVLREVGLETTGEGGRTNGSILKALDRKGVDRQEAEYAIRGLALRWRSGRLLGFGPDTPPDLRLLYGKRDASAAANKRPLWPQCVDEYLRHLSSKRKPAPGPVRITVGVSNG